MRAGHYSPRDGQILAVASLVRAQAVEITNGLDQHLISGLVVNLNAERVARKIRLASGLLAQIARTLSCLVLDGFEVRQIGAFIVRNCIGVLTTSSAMAGTVSGCEKAWTSRHDDIWVNLPQIAPIPGRWLMN